MATRLYGFEGTAPAVSPNVDAGWESSASPFARTHCHIYKEPTTTMTTVAGFTSTAGQDRCHRQWVSLPMAAGNVFNTGVTYKAYAQVLESATNDNCVSRLGVRIVSEDGSTVRHTVLAIADYSTATEFNTALRSKAFANGDAGTGSYTTVAGDRLVVEWGHNDAAGASISASSRWGGTGSDLPENETDTTTNKVAWFETSLNIVWNVDTFGVWPQAHNFAGDSTYRTVFPVGAFTKDRARVRVLVRAGSTNLVVTGSFIGEKAASGDAWDFASTPTRITWNSGANGFTIPSGTAVWSDWSTVAIDKTKAYIYSIGASGGGWTVNDQAFAFQAYGKSTGSAEAGTVDVTGYTADSAQNVRFESFEAADAAATVVTPAVGAVTAAGLAPVIGLAINTAKGAVTAAGLAPVVGLGINTAKGAVTAVGFAPTVTVSSNTTVAPALGAVTVTGLAPTVTASNHQTVTPGVGAVTVAGLAPVVTLAVSATPGAGVVTAAGLAPLVTATNHQTIATATGTVTAVGFAPVASSPTTVTAGVGAVTASGFAPTVTAPALVQTATGAVIAAGFSPTITAGAGAVPATGTVTVAGLAPTVTATQHIVVQTGVGSITAAGLEPTVTGGANATAETATGDVAADGLPPVILVGLTITPDVGDVAVAGLEPTVTATESVTVTPDAGDVVARGYAPTVLGDVVIAPPSSGIIGIVGIPIEVERRRRPEPTEPEAEEPTEPEREAEPEAERPTDRIADLERALADALDRAELAELEVERLIAELVAPAEPAAAVEPAPPPVPSIPTRPAAEVLQELLETLAREPQLEVAPELIESEVESEPEPIEAEAIAEPVVIEEPIQIETAATTEILEEPPEEIEPPEAVAAPAPIEPSPVTTIVAASPAEAVAQLVEQVTAEPSGFLYSSDDIAALSLALMIALE